jgi:uncharacterized protein (TIGR02453 family)
MPDLQPFLSTSNFDFLKTLKDNNNRDWFNTHKDEYTDQLYQIETFANGLLKSLNTHDVIETPSGKKSLQRIYRDTRFSKEKIPYKTHWGGSFTRAGKQRRGGYYYRIAPGGNSFIAGGFQAPNASDLKRIREEISSDPQPLREILGSKPFIETFEVLHGAQLKTSPKGFDAGDEAIDLLRYKQFLLIKRFSDAEVLDASYLQMADRTWRNMRPFFDYMSEILTTDSNGMGSCTAHILLGQ